MDARSGAPVNAGAEGSGSSSLNRKVAVPTAAGQEAFFSSHCLPSFMMLW
jgi:hypothetical protein